MITVSEGSFQPVKCKKCNEKLGYKVSKLFKVYSDDVYNAAGEYETMVDAESRRLIRVYTVCHCPECGTKLNFKIK